MERKGRRGLVEERGRQDMYETAEDEGGTKKREEYEENTDLHTRYTKQTRIRYAG